LVAAFAAAFLLPRESFVEAFGQHREKFTVAELVALKARFGASIMAIMRRALSLKLITDATYTSFCVVTSKWGWRSADKGEPGDDLYQGCETHSRFRQLVRRAVAEELISLSKGAALLGEPIEQVRDDLGQVIG
jgi:Zn-dependent peptidase ImmA (M78 family)